MLFFPMHQCIPNPKFWSRKRSQVLLANNMFVETKKKTLYIDLLTNAAYHTKLFICSGNSYFSYWQVCIMINSSRYVQQEGLPASKALRGWILSDHHYCQSNTVRPPIALNPKWASDSCSLLKLTPALQFYVSEEKIFFLPLPRLDLQVRFQH